MTRDVEMRYSSNNTAVARYTLAVNRQYKRENEQEADFLRCIAFGRTAELAERYLAKGMKVAVEGRIQTGSYTDREGQKIYTTDIVVERQEFLDKRSDTSPATPDTPYDENSFMDIPDGIDEELPFN